MAQPRGYNQITQEERDTIAALYAQRVSLSDRARQLKRNKSTISQEISRNKVPIRTESGIIGVNWQRWNVNHDIRNLPD